MENREGSGSLSLAAGLLNAVLALAAVVLALVAFFALLDLVLLAAAGIIARNVESALRGSYSLATVRNLWLILGGAGLVAFVIYTLDYGFKHWREAKARSRLLRILAIELLVIGAQRLLAG